VSLPSHTGLYSEDHIGSTKMEATNKAVHAYGVGVAMSIVAWLLHFLFSSHRNLMII